MASNNPWSRALKSHNWAYRASLMYIHIFSILRQTVVGSREDSQSVGVHLDRKQSDRQSVVLRTREYGPNGDDTTYYTTFFY